MRLPHTLLVTKQVSIKAQGNPLPTTDSAAAFPIVRKQAIQFELAKAL